jgi:hypothetical protein
MEARMVDKNSTREEILAWVAASNTAWFQRELDFGTEEVRYKILAALLENEMKDFKAQPSF